MSKNGLYMMLPCVAFYVVPGLGPIEMSYYRNLEDHYCGFSNNLALYNPTKYHKYYKKKQLGGSKSGKERFLNDFVFLW